MLELRNASSRAIWGLWLKLQYIAIEMIEWTKFEISAIAEEEEGLGCYGFDGWYAASQFEFVLYFFHQFSLIDK
jgi:hypothetical protein